MKIILEQIKAPLILIIPQETLLKTTLISSHSNEQNFNKQRGFSKTFTEQIHQLHVDIKARVELRPITLRKISQLSVGEILPFMDRGDEHVKVSANGQNIYTCELGRAGKNYTVRITNKVNFDEKKFKEHFL